MRAEGRWVGEAGRGDKQWQPTTQQRRRGAIEASVVFVAQRQSFVETVTIFVLSSCALHLGHRIKKCVGKFIAGAT